MFITMHVTYHLIVFIIYLIELVLLKLILLDLIKKNFEALWI